MSVRHNEAFGRVLGVQRIDAVVSTRSKLLRAVEFAEQSVVYVAVAIATAMILLVAITPAHLESQTKDPAPVKPLVIDRNIV